MTDPRTGLLSIETPETHPQKHTKRKYPTKCICIVLVPLFIAMILIILWQFDVFESISTKHSKSFDPSSATINDVIDAITRNNEPMTCLSIINSYIARIEQYDKPNNINSVVVINPNITQEAIALDEYYEEHQAIIGRLHCIPLLVKDNIDIKGTITSGGINIFNKEWMLSVSDADIIVTLRQEGAIWIAKTNLASYSRTAQRSESEVFGETYNPYSSQNRTVYGSSGGTAAAITSGFGIIGLGTDTLGSIILPATGANIFGVRPPRTLMSMDGIQPLGNNTDTVGPITRTIQDAAIVMDVILQTNYSDSNVLDMDKSINIGYINVLWQKQMFPNTSIAFDVNHQVFENQNKILEALNAINITLNATENENLFLFISSWDSDCITSERCETVIGSWNQYFLFHGNYTDANRLIFGPRPNGTDSKAFITLLNNSIGIQCGDCNVLRTSMRNFFDGILNDYNVDVVIFPGTPNVPNKVNNMTGTSSSRLGVTPNVYANLDYPAIAIPVPLLAPIENDAPLGLSNSIVAISKIEYFDKLFTVAYQSKLFYQREPPKL